MAGVSEVLDDLDDVEGETDSWIDVSCSGPLLDAEFNGLEWEGLDFVKEYTLVSMQEYARVRETFVLSCNFFVWANDGVLTIFVSGRLGNGRAYNVELAFVPGRCQSVSFEPPFHGG